MIKEKFDNMTDLDFAQNGFISLLSCCSYAHQNIFHTFSYMSLRIPFGLLESTLFC